MNLDDESQLSAFLDDELDPGDRVIVAWGVESSPALAQQLGELQATQSLIRGLARPVVPLDLTAQILSEIAASRPLKPRRRRTVAARFAASLAGAVAVAASLVVAMVLLHRTLHDSPTGQLVNVGPDRARLGRPLEPLEDEPAQPTQSARPIVADHTDPILDDSLSFFPPPPQSLAVARADLLVADGLDPAQAEQVDAMLRHRKVFRALIVTDVLDQTSRQVRSLIEHDPASHVDFGRITLTQGIVIDPDQPGEAEVYSLVMDEPNLKSFVERLRGSFPALVFDAKAQTEPALVTQLADVGQIAVFPKVPPAVLGLPPDEVARVVAAKAAEPADLLPTLAEGSLEPLNLLPGGFPADPLRPMPGFGGQSRARQARISPPEIALPKPGLGLDPEPSGKPDPVTVLVWIERKPRH